MLIRFHYLVAATAIAAMVGAPTAGADPDQSCQETGVGTTECSSPGNVQINDAPPVMADEGFSSGSYGGPYAVPFGEGGG
jgi:hypothetical protein